MRRKAAMRSLHHTVPWQHASSLPITADCCPKKPQPMSILGQTINRNNNCRLSIVSTHYLPVVPIISNFNKSKVLHNGDIARLVDFYRYFEVWVEYDIIPLAAGPRRWCETSCEASRHLVLSTFSVIWCWGMEWADKTILKGKWFCP